MEKANGWERIFVRVGTISMEHMQKLFAHFILTGQGC